TQIGLARALQDGTGIVADSERAAGRQTGELWSGTTPGGPSPRRPCARFKPDAWDRTLQAWLRLTMNLAVGARGRNPHGETWTYRYPRRIGSVPVVVMKVVRAADIAGAGGDV